MFDKKLLKRLRSLEDFLGVAYKPAEDKHDSEYHIAENYGNMKELEKIIDERYKVERKAEKN